MRKKRTPSNASLLNMVEQRGGGPQGMSLEPAADEEDGPSNSGRIH